MNRQILIVEDEPSISDTISYALSTEGFTPIVFNTATSALESLKDVTIVPIFAILDVGLPDMTGFELCKKIRSFSIIPILFLTARSDEIDKVVGFEIGADDYMVKPFSPRELVVRVKAILRRSSGEEQKTSITTDTAVFKVDQKKMAVYYHGKILSLSRNEFRLLTALIERPGRVLSREQLMNIAWEEPEASMLRTVDTHIKTIRAKLKEITPEHDPIETHRGFGYSLKELK